MNKLEERFEEIVKKNEYCDSCGCASFLSDDSIFDIKEECAKEAKEIAIEFVKKVLNSKITIHRSGYIGEESNTEEYWPKEFQLMLGQILKNGDEIFNEFIEGRYGK